MYPFASTAAEPRWTSLFWSGGEGKPKKVPVTAILADLHEYFHPFCKYSAVDTQHMKILPNKFIITVDVNLKSYWFSAQKFPVCEMDASILKMDASIFKNGHVHFIFGRVHFSKWTRPFSDGRVHFQNGRVHFLK